jgi:hypothetical protein
MAIAIINKCTKLITMFDHCRKVRHKNVVQFIGACTKPPILCIVTGAQTNDFVLFPLYYFTSSWYNIVLSLDFRVFVYFIMNRVHEWREFV